jgi:nucleoside-diphosphate-sugar epimerase
MLEAEQLLPECSFPSTSVRLGGIYGPGRTRLVDGLLRGEARYDPNDRAFTNRIHRDDCAGLLAHILDLPEPEPLYVGVDDEPAPLEAVLRWLAEQLGVPLPPPSPAAPGDASRRNRSNKRCSNARLRASGYELAYPTYREGYAELIAELSRRGALGGSSPAASS